MQNIEDVAKRLAARYRLTAVILFGSRARGDWGPWSDYDLLIIGDFGKNYVNRIEDVLELLSDVKIPVEPHPLHSSRGFRDVEERKPANI